MLLCQTRLPVDRQREVEGEEERHVDPAAVLGGVGPAGRALDGGVLDGALDGGVLDPQIGPVVVPVVDLAVAHVVNILVGAVAADEVHPVVVDRLAGVVEVKAPSASHTRCLSPAVNQLHLPRILWEQPEKEAAVPVVGILSLHRFRPRRRLKIRSRKDAATDMYRKT